MPAAEPMSQEIVERLKELLPRILPITIRDGSDYADLIFGEHATQAMTMDPATWLEIGQSLETLLSTLTNLTPSGVERIRAEAFEEAAKVAERGIGKGSRDAQSRSHATATAILALALPSEPPSQAKWICAAVKPSRLDPLDCNWPVCGCDPHAEKVMEALEEQGLLRAHTTPPSQGDVEGRHCNRCAEDLAPEQMECPFCGEPTVPVSDARGRS